MRRDELTLETMIALCGRLAHGLGRPFGIRAKVQAEEFHRVLKGHSATDVAAAVDRWLETSSRWPAPAHLRGAVVTLVATREADARRRQPPTDLDDPTCPACQTRYGQVRTWLVIRKSARTDTRRVVVEVEAADGAIVGLVSASRDLCDCGYRAALRIRLDLELRAMNDADPENPFLRDELRRRAESRGGRAARGGPPAALAALVPSPDPAPLTLI